MGELLYHLVTGKRQFNANFMFYASIMNLIGIDYIGILYRQYTLFYLLLSVTLSGKCQYVENLLPTNCIN